MTSKQTLAASILLEFFICLKTFDANFDLKNLIYVSGAATIYYCIREKK